MTIELTRPPRLAGPAWSASSAALVEQLAHSHAVGTPVRIVGSGTWLDAGRPVTADRAIHTRETAGVIEYTPGDLVITVGAGTTLDEVSAITREHDQWLALDPFGSNSGTVGATVATASSGPLASGAGRVRDLTLGLTMLASDGSAIHIGGRVVKNVAGFDLVRLATGAFGTLGIITEVSLRLHALPDVDQTFAVVIDLEVDPATVSATPSLSVYARLGLRALSFIALELVSANVIRTFDPAAPTGHAWVLLARIAGNKDRALAQRAILEPLGFVMEISNDVWKAVRGMDGSHSAVARVSDAPSRLRQTLAAVQNALSAAGIGNASLCATPSTGRVRVAVPFEDDDEVSIRSLVKSFHAVGASVVWERLPADCWAWVAPAATDAVSLRIRDAFDPHHMLNRGIFGPMGGHA